MSRVRFAFLIAVASLLLPLIGCQSPEASAQHSADQFLRAMRDGNREAFEQVLTKKARMEIAGENSMLPRNTSPNETYTFGETVVSDDSAVVPATITENGQSQEIVVLLKKEDKMWRVYGMKIPLLPGTPALTMNFEEPRINFGNVFRTFGQALGSFAREMESGAKTFEKGFEEGYGKPMEGGSEDNHSEDKVNETPEASEDSENTSEDSDQTLNVSVEETNNP
jgi:hypothetical protein